MRRGRVRVVQLHGEEDDVHRPDRGGIVGGVDARDVHIARGAEDAQPMLAHRREMRAPGDERHICTGGRQAPAEIPADAAASENGDAHPRILRSGFGFQVPGSSRFGFRLHLKT